MPKIITKEQWEHRIRYAGAGRYEFVRWEVDGEFGSQKKCIVRCIKDGYKWAAEVNSLVNGGHGCQHCVGVRRWTAEERVEQINKLENIEFVSWVGEYKKYNSKANVRCTVDGLEWSATVSSLVNSGYGCPQCAGRRVWTPGERIDQINKIENINFISWVGGYKNAFSKANVKCSVDSFEWRAVVNDLVNGGCGCPRCAKYGYQLDKKGYLYALRSECGQYVKVGISNKPDRRIFFLSKSTPFKFNAVECAMFKDGRPALENETRIHREYERAGFTGFDGCTEWLICTPELLEELRNLGD